jgi:electron transfer flavoprotein alpha subunit
MFVRSAARATRTASTIAGRRFASSLVFLEQKGGKLNDAALCAVTAAQAVGGDVSKPCGEQE